MKKAAVVIGATSGIGRCLAIMLADQGYIVGVTGRRESLLTELENSRPGKIFGSAFDITDLIVAVKKLETLVQKLGGLDLLILSSGTGHINPALNFELEASTINTNVLGFTCLADWGFNFFKKQRKGYLVAITSIAGLRGSRHAPAYNATKAFQISYLEGLRQKAGNEKLPITITDIRPGFVDTAMAKGEKIFWLAPVEKASRQIYEAIENKSQVVYITTRWSIIAFLLRLLPRFIYERL